MSLFDAIHSPLLGREAHFKSLKSQSASQWSTLRDYVEQHPLKSYLKGADSVFERRIGRPSLRMHLSDICYDLVVANGTHNLHAPIELCAPEIFNISTYEGNTALDGKGGGKEASNPNNLIRSHLWYSITQQVITDSLILSESSKLHFLAIYKQATDDVYAGQYIDANVLTFRDFAHFDKKEFLALYLKRCRLIGASTLKTCAASCLLRNEECPAYALLERLLGCFGVAGQILNDLSDFIARDLHFKTRDNLADLRNGRLTLPYFLLAENGCNLELLQNEAISGRVGAETIRDLFVGARLRENTIELMLDVTQREFSEVFPILEEMYCPERLSRLASIIPFLMESRILKALEQTRHDCR